MESNIHNEKDKYDNKTPAVLFIILVFMFGLYLLLSLNYKISVIEYIVGVISGIIINIIYIKRYKGKR